MARNQKGQRAQNAFDTYSYEDPDLLHGMQEVIGSTPIFSTPQESCCKAAFFIHQNVLSATFALCDLGHISL